MPQLLLTLLCVALLASCAAQTAMTPTDRAINAGYLVPPCPPRITGQPWSCPPPPPFRPTFDGGQMLTDLATIPLRLPLAMIENYASSRGRVTCRTYSYKDQYHATCY